MTSRTLDKPIPRFKKGDRVRYRGGSHFIVEAVFVQGEQISYHLREVLSEKLLKLTDPQVETFVLEKYLGKVD